MTAAERRVVRALLRRCEVALNDWARSYAPEFCDTKHLRESSSRVYAAGGTLAYIADLLKDIRAALSAAAKGKK